MPTHTNSTNGARMVGKKEAPPFVACNAPVTATQPAASSTRKTPVISNAPRKSPKPSHHSSFIRNPNPENGRRSKKRPASHTTKSATTSVTTPPVARKNGDARGFSTAPPPKAALPTRANDAEAAYHKTEEIMDWSNSRQNARSRLS